MTKEELINLIKINPELIADYIESIDLKKLEDLAKVQQITKLETQIPELEKQVVDMKATLEDLKKPKEKEK
jgi:hypothetical protein